MRVNDAQPQGFEMNNLGEGGNDMHGNNAGVAGQELVGMGGEGNNHHTGQVAVQHGAGAALPQFPPRVVLQRPMSPPLRRERRGLEIMETIDEVDEDAENDGNDGFVVEATLDFRGDNIEFDGSR